MKSDLIISIFMVYFMSSIVFAVGSVPAELDIDHLRENLPVLNTPYGVYRDEMLGSGVEISTYEVTPRNYEAGKGEEKIYFNVEGEEQARWYFTFYKKTVSGYDQYIYSDIFLGVAKDLDYAMDAREDHRKRLPTGLYWFRLDGINLFTGKFTTIKGPIYIHNEKY